MGSTRFRRNNRRSWGLRVCVEISHKKRSFIFKVRHFRNAQERFHSSALCQSSEVERCEWDSREYFFDDKLIKKDVCETHLKIQIYRKRNLIRECSEKLLHGCRGASTELEHQVLVGMKQAFCRATSIKVLSTRIMIGNVGTCFVLQRRPNRDRRTKKLIYN